MIEQTLKQYFQRFRAITPSADFASRSKVALMELASQPRPRGWMVRLREVCTSGSALALASFLLLALVGGVSYIAQQSGAVATSSFNDKTLAHEAADLTFQVQLKDAEYFDESASQVVRALDRLSGDADVQ